MAIAPISSVSFRNNYNQVNFEGKKKEKSSGLHVSNSIKAVPLATLIALSPLNTVDADAQVRANSNRRVEIVNTERLNSVLIDANGSPQNLFISFLDENGNKNNIERVRLESAKTVSDMSEYPGMQLGFSDILGEAQSLNNYSLRIVGDDGIAMGTLRISEVALTDGKNLMHPDVVDFIRNFANSPKNNGAIEIRNVTNTLLPNANFGLTARKKLDTSWIQKIKESNYNWGTKITQRELSTQVGNYKISFYSSDNNSNDAEAIIVERDDGVKFKLDGIRELNIKIKSNDGYIDESSLGCLDISWPGVGKFTIFDNELFNTAYSIATKQDTGKSLRVTASERVLSLLPGGGTALISKNDNVIK